MAKAVIMPRQGQSVESCVITKWEKQAGDRVQAGDILFSYETDKASFAEEAKADGILLAVFFGEQDDVPCLAEVAVIGEPGEDISDFGPKNAGRAEGAKGRSAVTAIPEPAQAANIDTASVQAAGASPRAKAAAKRLRADLSGAVPTGPCGRIIERDVPSASRSTSAAFRSGASAGIPGSGLGGRVTLSDQRAFAAPAEQAAGPGYHDEKLPYIRKVIAKALRESLENMAQLTSHSSFDATAVMAYRRELKASASGELRGITYNDFVLYAVSRVLKRYPALNAHCLGDTLRCFDHVHLGVAVDTPRGLLVPTIFNADTKSLPQLSKAAKELAAAARSGAIVPDLLAGASFTVSNLGALGIEMFTPIINPPQTGILGVDCIVDRVRVENGRITVYPAMGLSLTYDHRAVDGAPVARFLTELKAALENFPGLLQNDQEMK